MSSQPTSSNSAENLPELNRKAVALVSGGLDSALAVYLVKRQGVDVTGLHFTSFFSPLDPSREDSPVNATARELGIRVVFRAKGDDFIDIIRNPRFGWGKNLNPCIDCRIYTFNKAKEAMREIGASFLVTGEVVGQRPMSQRKDAIRVIEKQAGLDGRIVRPLSAKHLPITLPEEAGILDREQLLDVAGRGRKTQIRLAEEIGLTGYAPPAGGCLLTDKGFSNRLRDLLEDSADLSREALALLGTGRHLRIRPGLKIVIGRDRTDNRIIEETGGWDMLFSPHDFPGPVIAVQGRPDAEEEALIGSILRRYSAPSRRGEWIDIRDSAGMRGIRATATADEDWVAERLI